MILWGRYCYRLYFTGKETGHREVEFTRKWQGGMIEKHEMRARTVRIGVGVSIRKGRTSGQRRLPCF